MALTKFRSTDSLRFPRGSTQEEGLTATCIPGSTIERPVAALWNGHQFEAVIGQYLSDWHGIHFYNNFEYHSLIYYPIDPRIIESDVHGATNAYPNEAGSHWLFSHCTSEYHFDKELELVSVVESVFQSVVEGRLRYCFEATSHTRTSALSKYDTIRQFRDEVIAQVRKDIRAIPLSWFHINPNSSHVTERIRKAIQKVFTSWQVKGHGNRVSEDYNSVLAGLTTNHIYETRWEQVARIEAESKAKEETND